MSDAVSPAGHVENDILDAPVDQFSFNDDRPMIHTIHYEEKGSFSDKSQGDGGGLLQFRKGSGTTCEAIITLFHYTVYER